MNIALILAAGKSRRFGKKAGDKLLLPVLGKPLLYYTIQAFHDHPMIREVIIVAASTNKKRITGLVKKFHFPRVKKIITGGMERQHSLSNGFDSIAGAKADDITVVHNGANPLVTQKEISDAIASAKKYGAAAVGRNVIDTIKEIRNGHLVKTHDRRNLIAAQTPQAVKYEILNRALRKAKKQRKLFTDESSLVETLGIKVRHVPVSPENFKITTWHDFEHLKIIMGDTPSNFLVGIGQDSHEFSATRKGLRIGGLFVRNEHKLEADSDGDVVMHALYNAIAQALGEGSLGRIATPLYKEKGITKSKTYLQTVLKKVRDKGFTPNNIGIMIEAARPQIDALASEMKKSLSALTGLAPRRIGITATTGKKLTSFGQGRGIQCFAIVSLKKA